MKDLQNIQIVIESSEADNAFQNSKSLRKWLSNEDYADNITVKQGRKKLEEDEAGGELLAMLGVSFASSVASELGKSLFQWFQQKSKRQKALSISIKTPTGHEITLSGKELGTDEQEFIKQILSLSHTKEIDEPRKPQQAFKDIDEQTWKQQKEILIKQLTNNDLNSCFDLLVPLLEEEGAHKLQGAAITRQVQYEQLKQSMLNGTISVEQQILQTNQITAALLALFSEIDRSFS